jgi:YegS/Rv2252/BmrU family lipid kinase
LEVVFLKKMLLLVNPKAGQRKVGKQLLQIIDIFNRADYEVITHITAAGGDCTNMVLHYADQLDLVVCCGGDGTFNETISGVLKSGRDIPVGYIPGGSTNDFASSLGLSTKILQAAKDIVGGTAQRFDIGTFAGRHFSYVASFGAFTRTSYATPQSVKNALGHLAYVLGGIQEISQIKPHHLRFELPDGQVIEDDFIFGAVSNSTCVGGVLTLAPDRVDMSDGLFELLLVRSPKNLAELTDCLVALQKQTYNCSMITFLSTPSVTVTAPADMDWTLDGEQQKGMEHIEVNCLHQTLQLVCKRG